MPNDEHDNLMKLHESDNRDSLDIFDGYGDYDYLDYAEDEHMLAMDIFDGYGEYDHIDDDEYDLLDDEEYY
jgi:hypothetical protein